MEHTIRKTNKTVTVIMLTVMYAIMILLAITMIFPSKYLRAQIKRL